MATQSGGGRTREPGEMWNIELLDATSLDDAGYVLTYKTETTRKVDKAGATDVPAAVNYRSTRDPQSIDEPPAVFLIGSAIGVKGIPVFREGWAKLKLATNHSALIRGDPVEVSSLGGGKVDKYTPTAIGNLTTTAADVETRFDELSGIVGHVEEKANIAAGTTTGPVQDKVLCKLSIRAIGIIT